MERMAELGVSRDEDGDDPEASSVSVSANQMTK